VPLSSLEEGARLSSYSIPTTYYIDIMRKVMIKGSGFRYVWADIGVLIIFAVLLYTVCITLFRKRVG
jgi:ABC-2 type transport system permease protein